MHWVEPPGFAERNQERFRALMPAVVAGGVGL